MKKLNLILLFLLFSTNVFASPARFGGFSYKRDELGRVALDDETQTFNEGPIQLEEEPQQPYYLEEGELPVQSQDRYQLIYTMDDVYREIEENQKKSSINYTPQENKYTTPPIYSEKSLREKQNSPSEEDVSDDEIEEEEEE
ncbi:MAG: hypothetical protein K6F04_00105 [bacterium]|nr:hypothetical protein [bacterium]